MHIHVIIRSSAFTDPLCTLIREKQKGDYAIIVTDSYQSIELHYNNTVTRMHLFQVSKWIQQQNIGTATIHFLSTTAAYLIRRLDKNTTVNWLIWGGDLYNLPKVRKHIKGIAPIRGIKERISYKLLELVLPRIQRIFANPGDLHVLDQYLRLNAKKYTLNYLLDINHFQSFDQSPSKVILIGNSDDPANNHLELLQRLSIKVGKTTRILMPLSGVSNSYTKQIEQSAQEKFENVEILDRFVPYDEFHQLLGKCCSLVYGHRRQQGMATLFPFLLSGRRCYFPRENPFYKFLKENNFNVFNLDEIDLKSIFLPLSEKEKAQNLTLLTSYLSQETISNQWDSIFETELSPSAK